jgi:hypothetical protein
MALNSEFKLSNRCRSKIIDITYQQSFVVTRVWQSSQRAIDIAYTQIEMDYFL